MGIIVDMVVSTVCLVFASTVIGCSGMLAFVGELPDKLGLTTVGRGVAALLFAIPSSACSSLGWRTRRSKPAFGSS